MNNSELFDTNTFLKTTNLFWQYPVITEQTFYEQNKTDSNYCGIPWATIIDKRLNINKIGKDASIYIKHNNYYTCCQHILFRNLIPLFKALNIKTVYTPHKIKNQNIIDGVKILPSPLYAVNIEDINRNELFRNKDFLNIPRPILYSFMGGIQSCMSNIRNNIFKCLKQSNDVKLIHTGEWHFNKHVYSDKQNIKKELNETEIQTLNMYNYNRLLLESCFSLCPSGSGPNSIRLWESLACGSIPVLLADTLDLPYGIDWKNAIIFYQEKDIHNIDTFLRSITDNEIRKRRENCINIYNKLKNNFKNDM